MNKGSGYKSGQIIHIRNIVEGKKITPRYISENTRDKEINMSKWSQQTLSYMKIKLRFLNLKDSAGVQDYRQYIQSIKRLRIKQKPWHMPVSTYSHQISSL